MQKCILIQIPFIGIPGFPVHNALALIQEMAWHQTGNRPLPELMITQLYSAYIHHQPHWILDDVIKWKHFPRNWPFVRGIHQSPVNSPHKGQWRRPLMFSLISVWINDWVNNCEAGYLRRHRAHYDVIVMIDVSFNWFRLMGMCITRPQSINHYS